MKWVAAKIDPEKGALRGQTVLVIEDEPVIAIELATLLTEAGAEVVGPCGDADEGVALAGAASISLGVLDVRLGRRPVAPIARALERRGIPFLFYSGQVDTNEFRREWPDATFVPKPAPAHSLVFALKTLADQANHRP